MKPTPFDDWSRQDTGETPIKTVHPSEIWIIIPAHNEAQVIASVLEPLLRLRYKVVVVDDGSSDDTYSIAQKLGACVLRHVFNLGQGAALQTGITFALSSGAKLICTYDADGQHSPESIEVLSECLHNNGVDVVLGSRFLGQGNDVPVSRRLLLFAAVLFTQIHSGLRITDTHNGLRLMTARAARQIRLQQPRMAHASELLACISRCGLSYVEAPVNVTYTKYSMQKGQSALESLKILFDLLIARSLK
jgi:glycosyltransferase involved in cell wall biosynthesis